MPQRCFIDDVVRESDVGAPSGQVPISVVSVADIRRLEAIRLLDACGALHREGILDDHEYEAKHLELVDGLAVAERGGHR